MSDISTSERWARRRWTWAEWIHGDGLIAVLAFCRQTLTVQLFEDWAAAQKQLRTINRTACGGRCTQVHEMCRKWQRRSRRERDARDRGAKDAVAKGQQARSQAPILVLEVF